MRNRLLPVGVIGGAAVALLLLTGGSRSIPKLAGPFPVSPRVSATLDEVGKLVTAKLPDQGLGRVVAAYMRNQVSLGLTVPEAATAASLLPQAAVVIHVFRRVFMDETDRRRVTLGAGAPPVSWQAVVQLAFGMTDPNDPSVKQYADLTLRAADVVPSAPADFSKVPESLADITALLTAS